MAILSVHELHIGQTGQFSEDGQTYIRTFHVKTNTALDGPNTILLANAAPFGDLPDVGDGHNEDASSRCRTKAAARDSDDQKLWIVTCTYDSSSDNVAPEPNPLDEPDRVTWGFHNITEVVVFDPITLEDISNSADDPFDPPLTIERRFPKVTIGRNEAAFDPLTATSIVGHTNSDGTTIKGLVIFADEALMVNIGAVQTIRNNLTYFEVTYEIAFKIDAIRWKKRLLNAGLMQYNAAKLEKFTCKMSDKTDATTPQKLAVDGQQLVPFATPGNFLDFNIYEQAVFGTLGLT